MVKFRRVMPPGPLIPQPLALDEADVPVMHLPEYASARTGDEIRGLPVGVDMVLSSPVKETATCSPRASPPTMIPLPPSPPPPPAPLVFLIDPLSPVSEVAPSNRATEEITFASNVRRMSRLRKTTQVQPGTDVFNIDQNATFNSTRPLQRRRPNSQNSRSNADDVFSGMSMNALKTLTANNTVRNQHYVVAMLETEIVRKEGVRPESPVVKVKTTVQRQQEEKARQREERAARRAKRHGDDSLEDEENINTGYESPTPSNDLRGLHLENAPFKHKRGAGDEEDYETPLKNIDGEVKRRVKWDRGLYTEVFLDEVVLGSKAPPKENLTGKGCLTASAKVGFKTSVLDCQLISHTDASA